MEPEDKYTRITLRIPRDLHARLQKSADETSKSMNAEIIERIQNSYAHEASLADGFVSIRAEEFHATIEEIAKRVFKEGVKSGIIKASEKK